MLYIFSFFSYYQARRGTVAITTHLNSARLDRAPALKYMLCDLLFSKI